MRIYIFSTLLFLFIQNITNGQTFQTVSNTIYLTISSDYNNQEVYEILPLVITNTTDITISGDYTSETEVTIYSIPNTSIQIVPTVSLKNDTLRNCCTTVIRTNTGGPGKIFSDSKTIAKLYPNPVHSILTFSLQNKKATAFSVFDMNGNQLIYSKSIFTYNHNIDVSKLITGNYILKINTEDNQILHINFIKE